MKRAACKGRGEGGRDSQETGRTLTFAPVSIWKCRPLWQSVTKNQWTSRVLPLPAQGQSHVCSHLHSVDGGPPHGPSRHSYQCRRGHPMLHRRDSLQHHLMDPREFFHQVEEIPDPLSYVSRLRAIMQQVQSKQPHHHAQGKTHISADLNKCTHVFVLGDAVHRSLQPPYDDPFKVYHRYPKFFTSIGTNGKHQTSSLDRLKPAYLELPALPTLPVPLSPPTASSPIVCTTRSGHRVHFSNRLVL